MNKATFLFCVTAALLVSIAEATVSGVTCKQRWPFSGKVDVDFTLTSSEPQDILFKFTYTGQRDEPKAITNRWLDATVYGATNGVNHFVFDPAEYGVGDRSLPGLTVEPVWATNVSERLYLVLDSSSWRHEFLSETPVDGWTQTVYKTTKMPFRRVLKGTYTLGHTYAEIKKMKGSNPTTLQQASMLQRQVTLGSDYYIALFPMTESQHSYFNGGTSSNVGYHQCTYEHLRGNTNEVAESNINWPYTGVGQVKPGNGSFFGYVNQRLKGLVMDLPTAAQFEIAVRAGTTTIFPNGGTVDSTTAELQDLWLEFSCPASPGKEAIGLRKPNQWNIYNPIGMCYYWCLDAVDGKNRSRSAPNWEDNIAPGPRGLDPVGETVPTGYDLLYRKCPGSGYASGTGTASMPGNCRCAPPLTDFKAVVRPALHLADPRDDL